jgi:Domain of unknown function (DUF4384)
VIRLNLASYSQGEYPMKPRPILFPFLLAAVMAVPVWVSTAQDDDVRGAFMTTRPKSTQKLASDSSAKPVRRRPKTVSKQADSHANPPGKTKKPPTTTETTKTTETNKSTETGKTTGAVQPTVKSAKIGLGLTLYMRDANGLSVRTDPSHEFHTGDRVRVLLETNSDGFLYVFNTTDGGKPVMIYPDPDLDEAGNYIQAHVPVEVPSSVAAEERLRWFRFDKQAGVERLYFVFTREPLPLIPLEDDLIVFCRQNKINCPIQPSAELWAQVQKDFSVPVQTAKVGNYGATQTAPEQQATTRGIGLSKEDPEPSLVMMTASSTTNTIVATLDLIHK